MRHHATSSVTQQFDLVIKNGTLVTASDTFLADIGIIGETIAAIGGDLEGKRTFDAQGKLVLPGAVDPHVHLEMPVGATRTSDDWESGTVAAVCGGTTTVIDFIEPAPGETLFQALEARRKQAEGHAATDFALHMTLTNDHPETLLQVSEIIQAGCTSFKTYLTYEGFALSDRAFLHVLETVEAAGGSVMVHAENDAIIAHRKQKLLAQGKTAPRYHALVRPAIAETEAIQRAVALAEVTGACLYVVHVSTAAGAAIIRSARERGLNVFGETCPQYLLLNDSELERPDFEGAKFVCSPPLRKAADQQALWHALAEDDLQTVGTDHCAFNFHGQKELGRDSFADIPGGLPGIESRLALLYTFGVLQKQISLNRWVEICCTNPARIFNLYPQKGTLAPGADADLVVFDPQRHLILTHSLLHQDVDYTPYEGFPLQGYPVLTLTRGAVAFENGQFTGQKGNGRFLHS
jgi:dihydropyrimidinase